MNQVRPLRPDERLCFLHIVKTAGSSFSHHLKNQFNAEDICPARYWPDLLAMPEKERNRYRLISGHFAHDIANYLDDRSTRYVTMLRDPVARTISVFEYAQWFVNKAGHEHDYGRMSGHIDKFRRVMDEGLEAFVMNEDPDVQLAISNTQTLMLAAGDPRVMPDKIGKEMLDKAKAHLENYAYFGLTERMQHSLSLLSYTFGWRPFRSLEVNTTPNRSAVSDLPSRLVELIIEKNHLDMELYVHACELLEQRYAQMLDDLNARFPVRRQPLDVQQQLHDQLEKNYEQCFRENPANAVTSNFSKSLGSFPVGEGWWQWINKRSYRWSGPGTVSTLDIPVSTDKPVTVTFEIMRWISAGVLRSLRLKANGREVPRILGAKANGEKFMMAHLSPDDLQSDRPFVRLELAVDRTISYRSFNPTVFLDEKVGVAIRSIDIRGEDGKAYTVRAAIHAPLWRLLISLYMIRAQLLAPVWRLLIPLYADLKGLGKSGSKVR